MPKEKLVAVCRPHWACFIGRWLLALLFIMTGVNGFTSEGAGSVGAAIFAFIIAGFCIASALVMMSTTYLGMTGTKIVGHKGFIRSKTLSTPLSKVQNVSIESGLFGKMLGYGTVTISDAGTATTEFVFKRMANAGGFIEQVQDRI